MKTLNFLVALVLLAFMAKTSTGQNVLLEIYTPGVQYGNVNLDHLWIASSPDDNSIIFELPLEDYDSLTVGTVIPRGNAFGGSVLGAFGCYSHSPYSPKAGSAYYTFPYSGFTTVYFKLWYSKEWTYADSISIIINNRKIGAWLPQNTGNWNNFISTGFIEVELPIPPEVNAGPDGTICAVETYSLNEATALHYGSILWTTSGDGTFDNDTILNPVYEPGPGDIQEEEVSLSLTAMGENGIYHVSDCMSLLVLTGPKVYAGRDDYLTSTSYYLVSANVIHYSDLLWTSNDNGSFDDPTILNPTYTTATNEPGTWISLYLQATPVSPCVNTTIDSIMLLIPFEGQYYHPFQNWDDDVDRIKTYSNLFTGDHGIMDGNSANPQFQFSYDDVETRTGYGRSAKFVYGPLNNWSMYIESFKQRWGDQTTYFDLTNLFPDFADPEFQIRRIDSIAFYCRLDASHALDLKIELHDHLDSNAFFSLAIPNNSTWHRIAICLDQFEGFFNSEKAKFLGFVIAENPNYSNENGTLWLDDIYLVEKYYSKPVFETEDKFLQYTNQVNFRHFWEAVDPASKFALDRHTWADLLSVDAIGFQLTAYAIAHKGNWIEPYLVEDRVEHILDYLANVCQHGTEAEVMTNPLGYATVDGNWAHFLDYQTLARKDDSTEYSLFSNALLLSGVYVAKEYFKSNPSIVSNAESLISLTDWNFFYRPQDTLMYYSWNPVLGYSENFTDWFTEELDLSFLLAISTPFAAHRLPANPFFSSGYNKPCCSRYPNAPYVYSAPGANFTYYFLQMYADYSESKYEISRFRNAQNALLADKEFCNTAYEYLGYDERIFGTTACEGPDSAGVDQSGNNISNYHAYGYPCKHDEVNNPNGTVAVYGSASPVLFIPDESIACLDYYYNELDSIFMNDYGYAFWSPIFGFPDAFHLAPDQCNDPLVNSLGFNGPWISVPRFGIDIGPMLMNIDSYLSEKEGTQSIRALFTNEERISQEIDIFNPLHCQNDVIQSFEIEKGWSGISNYVNPYIDSVENIFEPIIYDLVIIRNLSQIYWPAEQINSIGNWDNASGYALKVIDAVGLEIIGQEHIPRFVQLNPGWYYLPVLSSCNVNTMELFDQYFNDFVIVQELVGTKVFWPDLGIFTLDSLTPGSAYKIKSLNPFTLNFPECFEKTKKVSFYHKNILTSSWGDLFLSPYSHVIAINSEVCQSIGLSNEISIGAFDRHDAIYGFVKCGGENSNITLYGDDPTTTEKDGFTEGEPIQFKLYDPQSKTESSLNVEFDPSLPDFDGTFKVNGLSAIKSLTVDAASINGFERTDVLIYPNPANRLLHIHLGSTNSADLEILNIHGQVMVSEHLEYRQNTLNISHLSRGLYIVQLEVEDKRLCRKLVKD